MGTNATEDGQRPAPLSRFQAPMHAIVAHGRTIDIRTYEVATVDTIIAELQPSTLALLRDGKALLGALLDACGRMAPTDWIANDEPPLAGTTHLPFERAIDASMTKLGSHEVVEEIAFIAHLELRQREERLARLRPHHGNQALLGECDSSLRRTRKALTAVDAAIAKVEAVPPQLDFTSELQTSLAVRRAYAKFRDRVMASEEAGHDDMRARFRRAGTQIAILVGWSVYPDMRVHDRLLLRDLQQRILAWLRSGPDATAAAGLRVWQDLAGCLDMFSLVNRRQDLVEHDSATTRALSTQLEGPTISEATWTQLRALEGLDRDLDKLIHRADAPPSPTAIDLTQVRAIVTRLALQFGPAVPRPKGDVPW